MIRTILFAVALSIAVTFSNAQPSEPRLIENKEFNWSITIPADFQLVPAEEWKKMQDRGEQVFEDTYAEDIDFQVKNIFVFKSGTLNYLESLQQPFDEAVDGDYTETNKVVGNMIYETFRIQMPDAKLDSARTVEPIDGLDFNSFHIKITYPNNMVMHMYMFSRLFGKQEFAVNIMYTDPTKGRLMMDAWRNSRFKK